MAIEVARYQFHSWSRKGISSRITEPDDLGTGSSATTERVRLSIPVKLNEEALSKEFALVGPGDIIGLNRDMVVRTEPLNWITNAEPNYLAFVEFYDEDFAWRYTPGAPVPSNIVLAEGYKPSMLRPWLFLLILKEDEFERTKRRIPLASVQIKAANVFPPANETWLWAHVHSNADIPDADLTDQEKFLISLNKTVDDDPDQLYCRLMSPRKLEKSTAYVAFVVPAFETGRLAGLGQATTGIASQLPSWGENQEGLEMPVYYEWSFRTGLNEDFESLVTALSPVKMDARVGIRDMDCSDPGFVKAYSDDRFPGTLPPVIGLEGALKSPDTVSTIFPDPVNAGEFPQALQDLINLPIQITGTNASGDPIISVPLYGGMHAKKSATDVVEFDFDKTSWLHDLNKDPRTRVAAGLGTLVVQKGQENYMQKAWQQVTNIIKVNRMIVLTQFHMHVSLGFTKKIFDKLPESMLLAISKPVLSRVMGSPTTVYQQILESRLPLAVLSGAFRRAIRPAILKRINANIPAGRSVLGQDLLVKLLNEGKLTAAAPVPAPGGVLTTKDFADMIAARQLGGIEKSRIISQVLLHPQKEIEHIATIPARTNFRLKLSDEKLEERPIGRALERDSDQAKKFRSALIGLNKKFVLTAPEKAVVPLVLTNAYQKVKAAVNPAKSFASRLSGMVKFPDQTVFETPEKIYPAMAYPDFEDPMYKKLTDISDELLLPNLKLIPQNCISLLKTNPKFIESYLVGLNHEMGRELLWREYPTDQRGSYFRQFWDVKGLVTPGDSNVAQKNKDIVPIDTWLTDSELGRHSGRTTGGDVPEKLVLVIRGDLLKKYPEAVIFCQKAVAGSSPDKPDILLELDDDVFVKHVKFPLFKAEISPDIRFFGFDLTIEQAQGTTLSDNFTDQLGWFFCIAEPPGEARFGMDVNFTTGTGPISWDNLAWTNLPETTQFITKQILPDLAVPNVEKARWGNDSAIMADILFQKPSMVAVHANQMLKSLTN